jgi:type I restriction enzyme S subunit
VRLVRLGDMCRPSRETVRPGERSDLRYIGLESIESGSGQFAVGALSKTPEAPQANSFRFGPEHVLYGKLRPYLNKVALPDFDGKCSTEILPLLPSAEVERAYLAFFLRSRHVVDAIAAKTAGARMPRADMDFVFSLSVPLPPLPEQRRIVDLLSRAEGIVRLRREAEKKAAELTPALFLNLFGHISPAEFQKAEKLCEFITKGSTPKAPEISTTNDGKRVPFLKVLHITDDGQADFERQPAFVSQELHRGLLARSVVKPNDVLMNIVGPPLGRICLVSATYPEWNINQALAIFRTREDVLPTYLFHALRSPLVLPNIFRLPVGVRQLNISLEQCRNIEVPVPTMGDQRKFVEKAEQVRSIQSQQSAATAKAQATFDALLARCFSPDAVNAAGGVT